MKDTGIRLIGGAALFGAALGQAAVGANVLPGTLPETGWPLLRFGFSGCRPALVCVSPAVATLTPIRLIQEVAARVNGAGGGRRQGRCA